MKPAIELERYEIEELSYVRSVDNEDLGSDNVKLAIESGMTEDRKNGKVTLKAKFVDQGENKTIVARVSGYFTINLESEQENYLVVNGAAIIFPYLRSAISMVSSLDSSDAVLIPTVNILSLLEEQAKDK